MKKKLFEKKLQLSKTTLANLDLSKVKGGYYDSDPGSTIDKICAIYSCGDACTWRPVCEGTFWCH